MAIPRACSSAEAATTKSSGAAAADRRMKLQHFLVMKAFNLRKDGAQTVRQQFQCLKRLDSASQSGRAYLDLNELCEYLAIPPFRRLVLCQVFQLAPSDSRLDFDTFVHFLQSTAAHAAEEEKALRWHYSTASLPAPPRSTRPDLESDAATTDSTQQLVCFQPTLLSSQTRFSRPPPAPGLWKKREITIQERITEYTKIDEHGRPQHLIEKEKHQTEVIHMENLEGEFAHREITQFEQTEQLNDEIVHHEHGREEFVHLKSEHDEISRFESSIPTGSGPSRPEECEQPPPSPTIKRDPSVMGTGGHRNGEYNSGDSEDHAGVDPAVVAMDMSDEEYDRLQRQLEVAEREGNQQQQELFEMESMQ